MLHILLGHTYPFTGNSILRLLLRGIHRLHPHTSIRAPPITPVLLLAVFQVLDHGNSLECSVYACALFLFFTMSRLGSMLPSSFKSQKSHYIAYNRVNVCVSDIFIQKRFNLESGRSTFLWFDRIHRFAQLQHSHMPSPFILRG